MPRANSSCEQIVSKLNCEQIVSKLNCEQTEQSILHSNLYPTYIQASGIKCHVSSIISDQILSQISGKIRLQSDGLLAAIIGVS